MSWMRIAIAFTAVAIPAVPARSQVKITDPEDQQIVQKFLRHTARLPDRISAERCRTMAAEEPEGYTWKIIPQAEMVLTAYQLTGDKAYLDLFVAVFANMRGAMTVGEDGYLGWYGKALPLFRDPDNPEKKVDVIISSFRAVGLLAEFLELVGRDQALSAKYAREREGYLDLAENHLIKKWDDRGCYVDLQLAGAIYRTHPGLRDVKGNLTQPHNKHSIILQALLSLYRATNRDEFMKKAVKLGTRFKHCLTLKDGHYEWNYWDPAGPWDVRPDDATQWKHWIGPEHRSGYYSHSLTQAVMLHHHGLVFDEADIERFLKTQLDVTWNGDLDNPQWFRVDRSKGPQTGDYICSALAPYDARIYDFLYTGKRRQERLDRADHPWQGGPVINGWLWGKHVYCPAASNGKQIYLDAGAKFLSNQENRRFCEALAYRVAGAGYRAPASPSAARD